MCFSGGFGCRAQLSFIVQEDGHIPIAHWPLGQAPKQVGNNVQKNKEVLDLLIYLNFHED